MLLGFAASSSREGRDCSRCARRHEHYTSPSVTNFTKMKITLLLTLLIVFSSILNAQQTSSVRKDLNISDVAIPPIISGCKSKKDWESIAACLDKKFRKRIERKIRLSVFTSDNLSIGKHKIISTFKISKTGEITNVKVQHSNLEVRKEIKRAFGTFKKMEPAMENGKPVGVLYEIRFNIEVFE